MSKEIKLEPGTVFPGEYDWETQFADALNGCYDPWVSVDTGKLRGLVLEYKRLNAAERQE